MLRLPANVCLQKKEQGVFFRKSEYLFVSKTHIFPKDQKKCQEECVEEKSFALFKIGKCTPRIAFVKTSDCGRSSKKVVPWRRGSGLANVRK